MRSPASPSVADVAVSAGSDPLTDVVTTALTWPLRELYAVLWRVGVLEVDD
ncbi:Rv1535 domain-containing protein [Mycolicibacterium grossiae]|uniref:Rv1535 domain-containing protein n=1 Tax=Mycolicibacterium grossiae TaxID=1552759 RepID=UPI0038990E7B